MKAFMEVEISEAEKTEVRSCFFLGIFGGFRAVRPFRIVFEPGGCRCLFSVLTVALLEWSISEILSQ